LPRHALLRAAAHTGDGTARKLYKAVEEFHTYIENNKHFIPNYGERYRAGERISTGFVESTVNQVISKSSGITTLGTQRIGVTLSSNQRSPTACVSCGARPWRQFGGRSATATVRTNDSSKVRSTFQ
jgi:hypothetical protein